MNGLSLLYYNINLQFSNDDDGFEGEGIGVGEERTWCEWFK